MSLKNLRESIIGESNNSEAINESLSAQDNFKTISTTSAREYYKGYLKERLIADIVRQHNTLVSLVNALENVEEARDAVEKAKKVMSKTFF